MNDVLTRRRSAAFAAAAAVFFVLAGPVAPASAHVAIRLDIREPASGAKVGPDPVIVVFAQPTLAGVDRANFSVRLDGRPLDPNTGADATTDREREIRSSTTASIPLHHLSTGAHKFVVTYKPDVNALTTHAEVDFTVHPNSARNGVWVLAAAAGGTIALAVLAVGVIRRRKQDPGWTNVTDDAELTGATTGATPAAPKRRRGWIAVAGALAIVVIAAGAIQATRKPTTPNLDALSVKPAKQFRLSDLRDPSREIALSHFRGKPVVVNFWASWCVPCRKEMPDFERVATEVHKRVAFVGINHLDNRRDAIALLRKTGVRYPVAFDPNGKTALAYGLFGMPTTLFISAKGQLLGRHTGQMSAVDLETAVTHYFGAA